MIKRRNTPMDALAWNEAVNKIIETFKADTRLPPQWLNYIVETLKKHLIP